MTVAELIAELQKFPPDMQVVVQHYDDMGYHYSTPGPAEIYARSSEKGEISWINRPFNHDAVVRVVKL